MKKGAEVLTMLRIGKIINCHGHKGELKVMPLTDDPSRFKKLKEVYLEHPSGRYELAHPTAAREHKNVVLLMLQEVPDMNTAEQLKNFYLCVERENAIKLPKDHYFIYEIVGLEVVEDGVVLGKVKEVLQTGGNDVYVVAGGAKEFCLPALKSVVKAIDLESGQMTVALPKGLLD